MSDISHSQLQSVQAQQQARDRELRSLRQQLREFQVQTDEHALIGGLRVACVWESTRTRKRIVVEYQNFGFALRVCVCVVYVHVLYTTLYYVLAIWFAFSFST